MNTIDCTLNFYINHLLVQTIQQYDNNNDIKISASKIYNFMALSIARLTE